ncbi:hypothetical protein [Traorella massiliensis]|uniref:hypothetical protein n=1 Tax=Traorella massiliensis TaxID=1903263 RepID=UPI0008F95C58|nr:hypothetical protein [Traorella massiliensis]
MGVNYEGTYSHYISWIITALTILMVVISILFVMHGMRKGQVRKKDCTVQTVGFIRTKQQTGIYVNENPQLLFELDALAKDGTVFQTSVQKIIPLTKIATMIPGMAIPIRYNSENRSQAVWDDNPDQSLAEELVVRYQCQKHPEDLSYVQRMDLLKNGVMKKVLLKSFRLTGRQEAGDWEAEAVIQLSEGGLEDPTIARTLYVTNDALEYLINGRYVDVYIVPGKENLFAFALDTAVASGLRKAVYHEQ